MLHSVYDEDLIGHILKNYEVHDFLAILKFDCLKRKVSLSLQSFNRSQERIPPYKSRIIQNIGGENLLLYKRYLHHNLVAPLLSLLLGPEISI